MCGRERVGRQRCRGGDTGALFTATCPEWVYFWPGAARIGAVTAAVNVANKDEFLDLQLPLRFMPCGWSARAVSRGSPEPR